MPRRERLHIHIFKGQGPGLVSYHRSPAHTHTHNAQTTPTRYDNRDKRDNRTRRPNGTPLSYAAHSIHRAFASSPQDPTHHSGPIRPAPTRASQSGAPASPAHPPRAHDAPSSGTLPRARTTAAPRAAALKRRRCLSCSHPAARSSPTLWCCSHSLLAFAARMTGHFTPLLLRPSHARAYALLEGLSWSSRARDV